MRTVPGTRRIRMCTCVRTCVRYVWYVYVHVYACVRVPGMCGMCMHMRTVPGTRRIHVYVHAYVCQVPGVYMCVCTCVRVPSVVRGMDDLEGQLVRVISAPVWYVVPGLPVIYLD